MADQKECFTRETLLRRVRRQHDQLAWDEFVRYYQGYVHNIARRMGLNHHDAEEIVQTVMLKCWQKLPEFEYDRSKGRFRGWLCTVAGNEVKMLIRRRSQGLAQLTAEELAEAQQYLRQVDADLTEQMIEREWVSYITTLAWQRIGGAVGEKEKQAFERLSRGALPKDVAEALDLTVSSVYVYKKRVQDRLREEIVRLNSELD
jgi:RNA polymerase sigma factor (sigma-70 family)